ncbi:hypothetical protein [Microbacterium lushaniae]|uniref:Uncharacterized protein n=1 Tax=Microbacterium lushaniae TaxID=2614639 RepID=A0A5J6L016_9MICO|nr:hypothetical protein [Microbacterium lushaniae]QEW01843.1 hypothetical protein F6J85_01160 [Microbacterium lushaniae]
MTMMRRIGSRRSLPAIALAGALLASGMIGCSALTPTPQPSPPQSTEQALAEYGDLSEAVTTAAPRVVAVTDPGRSRNGLGERLELTVLTDVAEPFSAEELDAVAEAIWQALPWEPNAIDLVAGVESAGGAEPVDLRTAAGQLSPMGFTESGQGGVSLFDMAARYGAWTAPE